MLTVYRVMNDNIINQREEREDGKEAIPVCQVYVDGEA